MSSLPRFDLFLPVEPGLEPLLHREVVALNLGQNVQAQTGGVSLSGTWDDIRRANLIVRGAQRVLVRAASFRAPHLAQLDKRARKVPWADLLRPGVSVHVETTCKRSRIYHQKAASERIAGAIETIVQGAQLVSEDADVVVKARIEDDLCTVSLDSTGEPLHRRGNKQFVGKAPMRETLASLFLAACDYRSGEPVVDPMCGSGTFVLEAAEIAAGLAPGRNRSFAFEHWAMEQPAGWRSDVLGPPKVVERIAAFGFDRDDGAIRGSLGNANRAGISDRVHFVRQAISDLEPPTDEPGLVITNPPYGARIGNRKLLFALYGTLGRVLRDRFQGWRVGIVTGDPGLAKATDLLFTRPPLTVPHGGIKVSLHFCDDL
ncbi:MAG: class I SAM-dependent RNA methyltransferase [Pseudomonadota bacterium]